MSASGDEATPVMDLVAPYVGASVVPVFAALFGAAASTTISHFLTKRRDQAADERQQQRDDTTARRHARELAEQRREAADEQTRRERIAAVRSFYDTYVEVLDRGDHGWASLQAAEAKSAAREFALQIKPLSPAGAKHVRDLLAVTDRRGYNYEAAFRALKAQKIEIFEELMTWAVTGDRTAIRRAFNHFIRSYTAYREAQL